MQPEVIMCVTYQTICCPEFEHNDHFRLALLLVCVNSYLNVLSFVIDHTLAIIYLCVYVCVCLSVCVAVSMSMCVCVCVYVCMCVQVYVYMCVCALACICACTQVCVRHVCAVKICKDMHVCVYV